MNMKLLIVDDDLPFRERLTRSMEKKGFNVVSSPGFKDSINKVNENNFDYAVVDMRLEDGSGLELVKELQKISPNTKSLLLTGYGNIATAVAAIKSGAIDYLPKPAELIKFTMQIILKKFYLRLLKINDYRWDRWNIFKECLYSVINVSETARRLRMHRRTLQRILNKHAPRE